MFCNSILLDIRSTLIIPQFLKIFVLNTGINETIQKNLISVYEESLRSNFFIHQQSPQEVAFNTQGFTEGYIRSIINSIVGPLIASFNSTQQTCVTEFFLGLVNSSAKYMLDNSIDEFRRASSALLNISKWFNNSLDSLTRYFTPLDICVNAFITLRCESCVRNIPPLCRGVCNSVIYGCYAVFQNGLKGQFNVLWNVTNQLINISKEAVYNISEMSNQVLPHANTTQSVRPCYVKFIKSLLFIDDRVFVSKLQYLFTIPTA